MKTLAVFSSKGGVGKTSTAVNLAYLSAQSGLNTLICDLDPQGSSTFYFRVKPRIKRKARGLSARGKALERSIKGTDFEGLDLLPADLTHRNLDIVFSEQKRRRSRLGRALETVSGEYDILLLDCPPSINLLAENVFCAADQVLVPLVPTTLCVRTYEQLLEFAQSQGLDTRRFSPFLSMVDERKKMHREFCGKLHDDVPGLLSTAIPYRAIIEQMGIYREPLPAFAPFEDASQAYRSLWAEIERILLYEQTP